MTDRISVFPGKYIKRTVRTAMLIFTIVLFLFCNAGISANAYADIEIYKTAQTASFPSFFTTSSPKLKSLNFEKVSKNKCRATLTWYAKKGCCYQVLIRKPGGKYKVIATRRAVSRIGVYIDKNLKSSSRYIYTVRRYNAE